MLEFLNLEADSVVKKVCFASTIFLYFNAKQPAAPVWPARWLTSVTLTIEEPTITRITLKSEIIDNPTSDELDAFISARGGMTQGWNGSLDRLEILLEKNDD